MMRKGISPRGNGLRLLLVFALIFGALIQPAVATAETAPVLQTAVVSCPSSPATGPVILTFSGAPQGFQAAVTSSLTQAGQAATGVKSGMSYHFTTAVSNKCDQQQSVNIYMVARGGKGARLDHGGKVLGYSVQNATINSQASTNVPLDFTVQDDIASGNVYVDVFVWDNSGQYRAAEPVHFTYQVTN